MRVISWNIRGALGVDGDRRLDRIAASLEEWRPDLICLQEVHRYLPGGGFSNQTSQLARSLGMHGAFASAMRGFGCFGNAILSRWPLQESPPFPLCNRRERKRPALWLEKRVAQRVGVEAPQGRIALMNTHWSLDREDRQRASEIVNTLAQDTEGPLVLCGDFNAIAGSVDLGPIEAAGLTDSGAAREAPTFPSSGPHLRIDYIWVRGLRVAETKVFPTIASDHCPVMAEIEL